MRVLFALIFTCVFTFLFSTQMDTIIAPNETDEELQEEERSCLKTVLAEFLAKGGKIVRLEKDAAPFSLALGDMVFPACSGGNNRSQTLWNILRPYADRITLMPPHGTRYGFDPYNGRANWRRTTHSYHDDEFMLWAGVSKARKFGWDLFGEMLSQEEVSDQMLAEMRDYYSSYYYGRDLSPSIRRVYITFTKNAHIHLVRLNEVNESLENVVVLLFPLEDLIYEPLDEWNTYPYSQKAYTELAAILRSYLDLSELSLFSYKFTVISNGN